jgi:nucleoid DNA-binding protein
MGLGKKDIIKNISSKTHITLSESSELLSNFLDIVKYNINNIKISKFGTFSVKTTPERIGRNPKTLQQFIIPKKERITFRASSNIKKNIN